MTLEASLREARARLTRATAVTVLTGAGVSADSGIPTFRGAEGLWRTYRAEDLATPDAFQRDPELVWSWYNWRRELIAAKQPNKAHEAIVEMERRFEDFWLITQNVDGLHHAAGSRKLSELHGNIWKVRCTACGQVVENREVPIAILPRCRSCGGLLRPHIVWFGETLNERDLDRSREAAQACEVMLIIGTSGVVYPAASLAPLARATEAFVVEVNLDPTPATDHVSLSIHGRASELIPRLL